MPKFLFLLLLFPLFGTIRGLSIWDSDSPPQLYSANDTGITTTNITDLQQKLYGQEKVTVFQFYNSCESLFTIRSLVAICSSVLIISA